MKKEDFKPEYGHIPQDALERRGKKSTSCLD